MAFLLSRKRARFDSPQKERWSLNGAVKLDEVYDFGVGLLESDHEFASDEDSGVKKVNSDDTPENATDDPHLPNISPKQDVESLSNEEWGNFHTKKAAVVSNGIDYFSQLSDEVMLHILHFLPKLWLTQVAGVCSRFHRLAKDESLWARIDVSNRLLVPGAIGHILSRQVVILRLTQSDIRSPIINPDCCTSSDNYQARLVYVDLGMAHMDQQSLALFFSKCQRLKKVSLEHMQVNSEVLTKLSLSVDLEVLNLAMVEGLNVEGLTALLTQCRKLRELNIAWTNLDGVSIKYICSNLPATLDRLNISGCRKLLTDTNVADLVESCPGLRELDLSDCTGLTGCAIQYIVQLKDLNFLALSRCYQIPYRSLFALRNNEALLYLDIHGGYIERTELRKIQEVLGKHVQMNKFRFSSVARPTVGARRSSIWNLRLWD